MGKNSKINEKVIVDEIKDYNKVEYEHVLNEIARLDGLFLRIVGFYSLLMSAAFVLSSKKETGLVLLIAPILSIIIFQYFISITYVYFSRVHYVQRIEIRLQKIDPKSAPCFWSKHDSAYFGTSRIIQKILIPFNGLMVMVFLLVFAVGVVSAWRSGKVISDNWGESGYYCYCYYSYYGVLVFLFAYFLFSAFWSMRKLESMENKVEIGNTK